MSTLLTVFPLPLLLRSLLGQAQRVWQAWCNFWFMPISTVTIGVFRIAVGALNLAFIALLTPDFHVWFSRDSMLQPATADHYWAGANHFSVLFWFTSKLEVSIFFAVFAIASFCLMIGLWSRFNAVLVFLCILSVAHRNPFILNGGDGALKMMSFYLMFAPIGAAVSVDRLRALARGTAPLQPPLAAPWAQRLLQLQICFIYGSTVLLKFKGTQWPDGTALYYTSNLEEFWRFWVPHFLFHHMLFVNAMTYWTLATEVSLAFLVWVPAVRKFVLLNGLALHLGIDYTMNIPLFSYIMVSGYLVFCDLEGWWERMQVRWPLRLLSQASLSIEPDCPACTRAASVVLAVDLLCRVRISDDREAPPGTRWLLRTPKGTVLGDLAALRWVAGRAPVLWPLYVLLRMPGGERTVRGLSRRIFGEHQRMPESNSRRTPPVTRVAEQERVLVHGR